MFETLIESKRKTDKKRFLGVGFVSLTIHTALIAAAIVASVKVGRSDTKVQTVVIGEWPEQEQQQIDEQGTDIQTDIQYEIDLPKGLPRDIPQVDLDEQFGDLKDHSRPRIEGGAANRVVPPGALYRESLVEEKPSVLSASPPPYPEFLKQAGTQGRVLIQAVIDTSGRAEPNSVRILQSPNSAFDPGSRNWILHALFRPARVHGRAVRVLIQVPLDYRITDR